MLLLCALRCHGREKACFLNPSIVNLKSKAGSSVNSEQVISFKRPRTSIQMGKYDGYAGGLVIDREEEEDEKQKKKKKVISELEQNDKEWQFFDTAKIFVQAGKGGDGCVAFRREKGMPLMGPCGGSGGKGGSVILQCDKEMNTLAYFRRKVHHRAEKGTNGLGKGRLGIKGKDNIVKVPPGTVIFDEEGNFAGELKEDGEEILVARGGRGGRGNEAFKTNRHTAPKLSEKGMLGAERWINLELKLVADVGFVGVPNAGKSTLLNSATNAKPKIANYPFTTVVPNLGVCDCLDVYGKDSDLGSGKGLVLADIPGLLEGAHTGRGLGIAFLRHVQRCRCLVHVVNGDSPDPVGDFIAINQELELFNPKLQQKPQVVVLNKIDIPEVAERKDEFEQALKDACSHTRVMCISAATGEGVNDLMRRLRKFVDTLPEPENLFEGTEAVSLDESDLEGDYSQAVYEIETDPAYPGQFRISGNKIETIAAMTNWEYYEAVDRFKRIMDAMGITKSLEERGAEAGDLIMIGDLDFEYTPDMFGTDWIGDDAE